ncbi:uncharacterized protein LOC143489357 [Brachyhypopomus gauderio]|uniref:uncharacterized protein LOC143489357 n=1 Tax=Brachyhypopomus gauderio TaxID=698409 RepID=UPI0040420785
MLRHYRACHENNEGNGIGPAKAVTRKEELDEALVSMIVKDTQPFSIVEDKGFRDFVATLDPTYVLPTRKAVKAMAEAKYQQEKEKAKAEVLKVPAEKLDLVQEHMRKPKKKLIQEVETRWNSTFQMLERVAELGEPVGAALAALQTDIPALTSDDYNNICACLSILSFS